MTMSFDDMKSVLKNHNGYHMVATFQPSWRRDRWEDDPSLNLKIWA